MTKKFRKVFNEKPDILFPSKQERFKTVKSIKGSFISLLLRTISFKCILKLWKVKLDGKVSVLVYQIPGVLVLVCQQATNIYFYF